MVNSKEGCNVAIVYNIADDDVNETKKTIEGYGGTVFLIKGNLKDPNFCKDIIEKTVKQFGRLDIIVNNAAIQHPQTNFEDITDEQLDDTFRTNIYPMFYLTRAAMPYLREGSCIINTSN